MNRPLFINGRFLSQPLSGVQRFATEITRALRRHYPERVVVLGPASARGALDAQMRVVGTRGGQFWEQIELPRHAKSGTLLNLGNTAPWLLPSQVLVIHDAGVFATPDAYTMRFRLWYRLTQRAAILRGTKLVAVSEFARGEIVRYLGADPAQVGLVSEGAEHMDAIAADRGVLGKLPPGRFVLAVGNLAAHKNLPALSALAARLAARGETLVITGGLAAGAFTPAKPVALPQPAHYVGRVSDGELKALYEHAACLVFPSQYEGFGLPAVEAMACGCLVVASRIPSLMETCGNAAVYVDPKSQSDIASAVCELMDNAGLQEEIRVRARLRASVFTWERAARQLVETADSALLGAPAARVC